MAEFESLIPDSQTLDPNAIRFHGFISEPLAETIGIDDLKRVSNTLGETSYRFWSYGWDQKPTAYEASEFETIAEFFASEMHKSILLEFVTAGLFFWIPEDHQYFIMFGQRSAVQSIGHSEISEIEFGEYLEEDYHSKDDVQFLRSIEMRYRIG